MADTELHFELCIPRDMSGLARLGSWVDRIVAALALPPTAEYALRLCVEEAVANVVMHGVPSGSGDAGTVALLVQADAAVLRVAVEDRCAAFDPLCVAPPERPTNPADAREGGLGIHLMRHYARSLHYARLDGANRLTMTIERN